MTPQEVIKNFMAKLTTHGYTSSSSVATKMLNDAVKSSSRFSGIKNVIDAMKADQIEAERQAVVEVLGSEYEGKTMSDLSSKVLTSSVKSMINDVKADIFLKDYCGIILENDDTGAITGADANISLTAGDVVYGTTLTAEDLQAFAAQDGMTLSDGTLIIGTGVEKDENSVVPETGNLYIAATSTAQSISTGANDWLVVATDAGDTILTGGADSIDAGAGNDSITVGADHASIVTGAGSDTVNISAEVTTVTLEDFDSNDALTISGTFQVGSAQIDDTILVVTDKTGTRQIRLGDFDNAKNARINGTTIANWLSNAGIDISKLESSSASVVEESAPLIAEETGGGRVDVEKKPESDTRALANTANQVQDLGGTGNAVALGNVTITGGSVTNGGNKLGDISSAFPNISTFTKRGLTINLLGTSDKTGSTSKIISKTLDRLTDDQKTIVAGLFKWWAKECLKLNEESYGISFKSDTAMVDEIGLFLYDSQGSGNTLATVWTSSYSDGTAAALKLSVNMNYYKGISEDNVDGQSSKTSAFLDRTLSHEFTHAVMGANVKFFSKLPQFISEGMAELTHGIDDERYSRIFDLAYDAFKLTKALDLTNTGTGTADAYAGGYMFLRYFAKQAALMDLVDYANPASAETWELNGTTATYKVGGTTMATLKGLKSGLVAKGNSIDGITVDDGTITLSKNVLGTSNVTLTLKNGGDYTLALGEDAQDETVTIGNKAWTVNTKKGTATLKGNTSAGYALSSNGLTITYSAAKTGQVLATVSGLSKNIKASDFDANSNVITLKKSMVGTAKVTVTGDGYTLALSTNGDDTVATPTLQPEYWTASKTTAAYKQTTTAGFTLTGEGKTATYSKAKTVTLATVDGIKNVTAANKDAVLNALSVDADKKITIGSDALGTAKITVKGTGYTIAAGDGWDAPVTKNLWAVSKNNAAYDTIQTAYFAASTDNRTLTYKKQKKLANLVTVQGLAKGAAVDANGNVAGITLNDKTVTLAGNDLFGSKVVVSTASDYTLDNQLTAPSATKTYWTAKKGSAALKQDMTDGYTLTTNAKTGVKTLTYSKAKTATVTTVSGLDTTLKATDGAIDGLTYNLTDKVVTADTRVLTKGNVSIKGNSYTLALAAEGDYIPRTALVEDSVWSVSKTTAAYKDVYLDYFTRKSDTAFTYKKQTAIQTLAKVSGLRNNASPDSLSIDEDGVITLTADALVKSPTAKTKIALSTKENYTLKLADGIANVEYNAPSWSYSKGKATYASSVKTAGYLPADDAKSIGYIPSSAKKTLATVSGVKSASGISISEGVISLTDTALNKTKVTLATAEDYTLALAEDSLASAPVSDETWAKDKTTATLTVKMSAGYTQANEKTITYSGKVTTKTLATIAGINKNADISTFQAVEDGDTKKISLTTAQLGKKVSVSGAYEYDFASDYSGAAITGSAAADDITVAGTGLSITGGKGDDSIDLGTGGGNVFIYASGEGKDVIADFTATDRLKITKGTPVVESEDSDVIVTVGAGSIRLTDAAGQTISILDSNNKTKTYSTTAPTSSADLLISDNFDATATLSNIVKPAMATYTPYDFSAGLGLTKEDKLAPALTYGDKK